MDDWHIGIRHTGDYALECLDGLFPGAWVDDHRVPDNYSVALSPARKGRAARELHLLVKGGQQLVRSRSVAKVLRGLLTYLTLDLHPSDETLLTLQMAAMVRDGAAVLVPADVPNQREQLQPRIARLGFQLVDMPRVLVDPATQSLVVPEPQIAHDAAFLASLDGDTALGSELPPLEPGRYPIAHWLLWTPEEAVGPIATPQAVATLVGAVAHHGADFRACVEILAPLLADADVRGITYDSVPELVAALREL